MNLEIDVERLTLARKAVRAELLAERAAAGQWVGHLGSSPFATAAAVSALVAAHRRDSQHALQESATSDGQAIEQVVQGDLSELLLESVHWLARRQNPDGGWGDCEGARSNIAATMLVQAAFRLTGIPAKFADLMVRADKYVMAEGGIAGLRTQCGRNKTLLAAILTNCALAGMVSWRQVPTLQFELECLPKLWQRDFQVFAARYDAPAVLAVGRAKFHYDPPKNPVSWLLRRSVRSKSLVILGRLQSADDSFLASAPLTAFVVMSLSSIGCQEHPIVERGIEFLLSSVRADSSWSVTPNLAVSNTALAWNSLAADAAIGSPGEWTSHETGHLADDDENVLFSESSLSWLLGCQRTEPNPLTDVPAGGWASSDAAGALPNTSSTAGVIVALAGLHRHSTNSPRERLERAAGRGIAWLLDLQNADGGWPAYYRDDTLLRFDESGTDVTAQVLQSLVAWRREWQADIRSDQRIAPAIESGWKYLESQQQEDGSFIPLWFGNEHQQHAHNPVYSTAQVLIASAELERLDSDMAQRAARWLVGAQHMNGGWGPPRAAVDYSTRVHAAEKEGFRARRTNEAMAQFCSIEETALGVSALIALADKNKAVSPAVSRGLTWLINAVEQDSHRHPAIIGFYLSKLWYDERLYPLAYATEALSRALRSVAPVTPAASHAG